MRHLLFINVMLRMENSIINQILCSNISKKATLNHKINPKKRFQSIIVCKSIVC